MGALGVAGLAVGVGFGIAALGKGNAWKEAVARDCNNAARDCQSLSVVQSIRALESDRSTFATASTIGFVAGAVALGGGLTLWLLSPKDEPRAASITMAPWAGSGSAGIVAKGAF